MYQGIRYLYAEHLEAFNSSSVLFRSFDVARVGLYDWGVSATVKEYWILWLL